MTIAITGATGQLGRLVIEGLKAQVPAEDIVALVRDPDKAADFGVAVRAADYDRPDTLETALAGIGTLLLISSSEVGKRAVQHDNVIAAAKAVGVRRIIYTSILHADASPLALAGEHRATEAALKASGLAVTLLRNGWYTENYTGSVGPALAGGAVIGSAGDGRVSSAPRADYADAAVAVLTGEGHEGKTYELAGDTSYTLSDFAAEISRQSGKDIGYKNLQQEEYAAALASWGLPQAFADVLADSDAGAARGALFDDGRQLSALIGHPTGSLADAVAIALKG